MPRILFRRDTAENWTEFNPVLHEGEFGYELDTGQFKIGQDGLQWNDLSYGSMTESILVSLILTPGEVQDALQSLVGEGSVGPAGDTAYEVAVDNGFVGTESAWLASLVGPQGETGAQGPQGADGYIGEDGLEGPQGPIGLQGPQGIQGLQGPMGLTGAAGSNGTNGTDGMGIYLLEAHEDAGDVPVDLPIGTIVFQKLS